MTFEPEGGPVETGGPEEGAFGPKHRWPRRARFQMIDVEALFTFWPSQISQPQPLVFFHTRRKGCISFPLAQTQDARAHALRRTAPPNGRSRFGERACKPPPA